MKPRKVLLSLPIAALVFGATSVLANASSNYYSSISNTTSGTSLASNLHNLISSNTKVISYNNLYQEAYPTTDVLPGTNIVWDIYSNEVYNLSTDSGASATSEGGGFNREHTIPQSWFAKASPMVSDIYHIYPTDIYVNNQRSSYMYDDVSSTQKNFYNGSKLGTGTIYNNKTTFEIADEYKGDIARGYFYMAIRYSDKLSAWTAGEASNVFSSSYPYLTSKAISVFTKWAHDDPVSDKEMLRNEETYKLQNNRNPFIDHPEWVDTIWQNNYTDSKTNTQYTLSDVNQAISSLSTSSTNDTIYKTYNKYCRLTVEDKEKVTNTSKLFSLVESKSNSSIDLDSYWPNVIQTYNSTYKNSSGSNSGSNNGNSNSNDFVFNKVTSTSSLKQGDSILIVYESNSYAISTSQGSNNRGAASVSISNNTISNVSDSIEVIKLEKGSSSNSCRLKVSSGYLCVPSNANKLTTTSNTDTSIDWTITISNGIATIRNVKYSSRYLQFNTSSKVFAGYSNTQKNVSIYKMNGSSSSNSSDYTSQFENESTSAKLGLNYSISTSSNGATVDTITKSSFQATSGSLNDYVSFSSAKGGASTNPQVYNNIIRIYQNGGKFTVSAKNNARLTKIVLGSQMSTKVTYSIDGGSESSQNSISQNGKLTISGLNAKSNVVFTCKGTSSSQRLYVNYLAVTYEIDGKEVTTYTYSDVSMTFNGSISSSLYNSLKSLGNSVSFGVRIKSGSTYSNYQITPSLNGSNYVISRTFNVSSNDYSLNYTAQVYVSINGDYYYMNEVSYSINSLVEYYISNASSLGISNEMLEALRAFK